MSDLSLHELSIRNAILAALGAKLKVVDGEEIEFGPYHFGLQDDSTVCIDKTVVNGNIITTTLVQTKTRHPKEPHPRGWGWMYDTIGTVTITTTITCSKVPHA